MGEFPNDNQALWVRRPVVPLLPRGLSALTPIAVADVGAEQVVDAGVEPDDDDGGDDIEIVDDLGPLLDQSLDPTFDERAHDPAAEEGDPYADLVRVVTDVVRDAAGEALGSVVAKILGAARLDDAIPEATVVSLVEGGIVVRAAKGLVRSETFTQTALAWSRVLRGESDDLGACGARTLDEWVADLTARILAAPGRFESLRRDLRRRGVAAFGLLAA